MDSWYKRKATDRIWWKDIPDRVGEWVFSFDKQKEYNMFADYPHNMTEAEVAVFDAENPYWADFFSDRKCRLEEVCRDE